MKTIISILCLLCLITYSEKSIAQESKSSLLFSGILSHYIRSGEKSSVEGFYNYPVDPGLEIVYQYKLNNSFFISSGINFQHGRIANYKHSEDRLRFNELSIPLVAKAMLYSGIKSQFYISSGISLGWLTGFDWESPDSADNWKRVDYRYDEDDYSGDNFFIDILFSPGVAFKSGKNGFSVAPYFNFRLNDYWIGSFREKFYYGIKMNYQLNLQKK